MNNHNSIRIIQVSDCHLSADREQQWFGRNPVQCLNHIITSINNNEHNNVIVLATGDLSHDGSNQSYSEFLECVLRLETTVHTLPGNHDHPGRMNKCLNKKNIDTTPHFITGGWLVIMVDTVASGEEYGYLAESEITRIQQLLSAHKDKQVLIAMHHPPVEINSAWIDKIKLSNSDAFFNAISGHQNIQAVITGHVHQDTDTMHHGVRFLSCPSTCHQFLPNSDKFAVDDISPGYRWLELHHDGNIASGITRVTIAPACHAS